MGSEIITIALVEDHAEFRNSLCEYINNNKAYQCTAFPNSQSILSRIKETQSCPQIILTVNRQFIIFNLVKALSTL